MLSPDIKKVSQLITAIAVPGIITGFIGNSLRVYPEIAPRPESISADDPNANRSTTLPFDIVMPTLSPVATPVLDMETHQPVFGGRTNANYINYKTGQAADTESLAFSFQQAETLERLSLGMTLDKVGLSDFKDGEVSSPLDKFVPFQDLAKEASRLGLKLNVSENGGNLMPYRKSDGTVGFITARFIDGPTNEAAGLFSKRENFGLLEVNKPLAERIGGKYGLLEPLYMVTRAEMNSTLEAIRLICHQVAHQIAPSLAATPRPNTVTPTPIEETHEEVQPTSTATSAPTPTRPGGGNGGGQPGPTSTSGQPAPTPEQLKTQVPQPPVEKTPATPGRPEDTRQPIITPGRNTVLPNPTQSAQQPVEKTPAVPGRPVDTAQPAATANRTNPNANSTVAPSGGAAALSTAKPS